MRMTPKYTCRPTGSPDEWQTAGRWYTYYLLELLIELNVTRRRLLIAADISKFVRERWEKAEYLRRYKELYYGEDMK